MKLMISITLLVAAAGMKVEVLNDEAMEKTSRTSELISDIISDLKSLGHQYDKTTERSQYVKEKSQYMGKYIDSAKRKLELRKFMKCAFHAKMRAKMCLAGAVKQNRSKKMQMKKVETIFQKRLHQLKVMFLQSTRRCTFKACECDASAFEEQLASFKQLREDFVKEWEDDTVRGHVRWHARGRTRACTRTRI